MIIKGDLDRMAEDIGHAGKSQEAARGQPRGRMTFSFYILKKRAKVRSGRATASSSPSSSFFL